MEILVNLYAEKIAALKKNCLTAQNEEKIRKYLEQVQVKDCDEINADKIFRRREADTLNVVFQTLKSNDANICFPDNAEKSLSVELLALLYQHDVNQLAVLLATKTLREKLVSRKIFERETRIVLINELRERLNVALLILGETAYSVLGYCEKDVDVLESFFQKGHFSGTMSLNVRQILKKIWLETPVKDSILTPTFFDDVDKIFKEINKTHKEKFSLSHIPPVSDEVSLEKLCDDWLKRWEYYSDYLQIDLNSGITDEDVVKADSKYSFCQDYGIRCLDEKSEYEFVELLNYWMPYLLLNPFAEKCSEIEKIRWESDVRHFASTIQEYCYDWMKPYKEFFGNILFDTRDLDACKQDPEKLESEIKDILWEIADKLDKLPSIHEFPRGTIWNHWQQVKNIICVVLKTHFKSSHNANNCIALNHDEMFDLFDQVVEDCTSIVCSEKSSGRERLKKTPSFVDPYYEFLTDEMKASFVSFNGRDKLYLEEELLGNDFLYGLRDYENSFVALSQETPEVLSKLEYYKENIYDKLVVERQLLHSLAYLYVNQDLVCRWEDEFGERIDQQIRNFENKVENVFHSIMNDKILDRNRGKILALWKEKFSELDISYIEREIEQLELKGISIEVPLGTFENKIKYLKELDLFEQKQQEQQEIRIQENTKEQILFEMSHSIKNLVATVIDPLLILKNQLEGSQLGTIERALAGTGLIRALAQGIHYSMRGEIGAWRKDIVAPGEQSTTLEQIIKDAICYAVPNMFDGKYFQTFLYNYFQRDRNLFMETQKEWAKVDSLTRAVDCIQRYFFAFNLNFTGNLATPIGDSDGTATKLLILFQELFLNAVKYASFTPRENRFVNFSVDVSENKWIFILENSADEQKRAKKSGLGLKIIKNFATLFEAEYQVYREDDVYRTMLIFDTKKEA